MFSKIQNSHSLGISGSFPQPVRTGYDSIIAHRVDGKFSAIAKGDGKVTEVSNNHISIQYKDGSFDRFKIGLDYGVSTGNVINNMLVTDYKVGQAVKKGDVVAFHPLHFQRDFFDKSQVLFKNSALGLVAMMESNDTEEDSSAISERMSQALSISVTEPRSIVISFDDQIHNLVSVGDHVESDTPLCTLVNAVFSENSMFNKDTDIETLKQLANVSPRAKHHGVVTKIEVMYLGDPIDASDSVKALINKYDRERRLMAERLKVKMPITGRLNDSMRVEGNLLPDRHLVVKFYIEHDDGMGIGDER